MKSPFTSCTSPLLFTINSPFLDPLNNNLLSFLSIRHTAKSIPSCIASSSSCLSTVTNSLFISANIFAGELGLSPVEDSINKFPKTVIKPPGTPCPVQSAAMAMALFSKDLNQ